MHRQGQFDVTSKPVRGRASAPQWQAIAGASEQFQLVRRQGRHLSSLDELESKTTAVEAVADVLMQNHHSLSLWGVTHLIGDFPTKPMNTPLRKA